MEELSLGTDLTKKVCDCQTESGEKVRSSTWRQSEALGSVWIKMVYSSAESSS